VNLRIVPVLALSILLVAACGGGSSGVTAGMKFALLLPATGDRFDALDRPAFLDKLGRLCADCQVLYSAAKQGADQEAQAKAAITGGAGVIVLDPVDMTAAATIVAEAKAANIPVISYDGMVANTLGLNYYVGFDTAAVRRVAGQCPAHCDGRKDEPQGHRAQRGPQ